MASAGVRSTSPTLAVSGEGVDKPTKNGYNEQFDSRRTKDPIKEESPPASQVPLVRRVGFRSPWTHEETSEGGNPDSSKPIGLVVQSSSSE